MRYIWTKYLVAWNKKQQIVAKSSLEAEYKLIGGAAIDIMYINSSLYKISFLLDITIL